MTPDKTLLQDLVETARRQCPNCGHVPAPHSGTELRCPVCWEGGQGEWVMMEVPVARALKTLADVVDVHDEGLGAQIRQAAFDAIHRAEDLVAALPQEQEEDHDDDQQEEEEAEPNHLDPRFGWAQEEARERARQHVLAQLRKEATEE